MADCKNAACKTELKKKMLLIYTHTLIHLLRGVGSKYFEKQKYNNIINTRVWNSGEWSKYIRSRIIIKFKHT